MSRTIASDLAALIAAPARADVQSDAHCVAYFNAVIAKRTVAELVASHASQIAAVVTRMAHDASDHMIDMLSSDDVADAYGVSLDVATAALTQARTDLAIRDADFAATTVPAGVPMWGVYYVPTENAAQLCEVDDGTCYEAYTSAAKAADSICRFGGDAAGPYDVRPIPAGTRVFNPDEDRIEISAAHAPVVAKPARMIVRSFAGLAAMLSLAAVVTPVSADPVNAPLPSHAELYMAALRPSPKAVSHKPNPFQAAPLPPVAARVKAFQHGLHYEGHGEWNCAEAVCDRLLKANHLTWRQVRDVWTGRAVPLPPKHSDAMAVRFAYSLAP